MNILVVDDEENMVQLISSYLKAHHYHVYSAGDGIEAIDLLRERAIDLILLDIMMPNMDGLTACRQIRDFSNIPIIMLTAKSNEDDRVTGLKMGADDYIIKPFSPRELMARVEAALRRTQGYNKGSEGVFQRDGLTVDLNGHVVQVNGSTINLTRKEFLLLSFLVQHRGQVFTREQILDHIWGLESLGTTRTVDTHIKTLRLKLKTAGDYIQTVWGVGYKFT
ncbi:response regulator transcription factor [Halobacillus salinarum]|uniref:Response regulator transcription factor n=1 Tax=Halobacillus salinarum TaxID=2932257 RepID=A0ABY4EJM0_9BACI|nr:response regulator transcription factor [Halobacillus salinarum]UOQ44247.1 response regulator transcription factor [Halobacillus salinarum]